MTKSLCMAKRASVDEHSEDAQKKKSSGFGRGFPQRK